MGLFGFDLVKRGWRLGGCHDRGRNYRDGGKRAMICRPSVVSKRKSQHEEEAAEAAFMEQRKATAVPTDLNKLTSYRSTPRSTESEFFKDVAGKAPLFGKDKWREKFATAPLLYGAVVQANSGLWLPGREDDLPAVFVFALDRTHIYDIEWLTATAEKISEMKESP